MTKWRDMESAPRDWGNKILAWVPETHVAVSWYDGRYDLKKTGWIATYDDDETYFYHPTHWQPLPEPPERE